MSLKIDHQISALLYSHDCVIIPSFGGFVANYQSTKIHPTQHTFTPPSKKIAFNKSLQNNDGLLANQLVTSENISYSEANKIVSSYVEQLNKTLQEEKKIIIEKVGTLFYDVEHNIQFEADSSVNYLLDSFGLTVIQSPPIKRENFQQKIEKQFKDRPAIKPVKTKLLRKHGWKVGVALPLVALMVWVSFNKEVLHKLNFEYSYLNPFSNSVLDKGNKIDIEKKVVLPKQDIQPIATDTFSNSNQPIPETPTITKETPVTQQPDVMPTEATNEKKYFVIGGCFAIPENAENFVKILQTKGFPSAIIGKSPAGLIMVCYKKFETREEAASELVKIKTEQDSTAWLYHD